MGYHRDVQSVQTLLGFINQISLNLNAISSYKMAKDQFRGLTHFSNVLERATSRLRDSLLERKTCEGFKAMQSAYLKQRQIQAELKGVEYVPHKTSEDPTYQNTQAMVIVHQVTGMFEDLETQGCSQESLAFIACLIDLMMFTLKACEFEVLDFEDPSSVAIKLEPIDLGNSILQRMCLTYLEIAEVAFS